MNYLKLAEWVLRIGIFLTFIGHGTLAWQIKTQWIQYLTVLGFTHETAQIIMPLIGLIDWLVAILVLLRPFYPVVLWCFIWGFATALVRPIAGEPLLAFIERGANWAAPLALLLIYYAQKSN